MIQHNIGVSLRTKENIKLLDSSKNGFKQPIFYSIPSFKKEERHISRLEVSIDIPREFGLQNGFHKGLYLHYIIKRCK